MKSRLLEKKDVVKYISLEFERKGEYLEPEEAKFILEAIGVYPAIEFNNSEDCYTLIYETEEIDGNVYNLLCYGFKFAFRGYTEGITILPMLSSIRAKGIVKYNKNKRKIGFCNMVKLVETMRAYDKRLKKQEKARKSKFSVIR